MTKVIENIAFYDVIADDKIMLVTEKGKKEKGRNKDRQFYIYDLTTGTIKPLDVG